jgi:hypothetical protein
LLTKRARVEVEGDETTGLFFSCLSVRMLCTNTSHLCFSGAVYLVSSMRAFPTGCRSWMGFFRLTLLMRVGPSHHFPFLPLVVADAKKNRCHVLNEEGVATFMDWLSTPESQFCLETIASQESGAGAKNFLEQRSLAFFRLVFSPFFFLTARFFHKLSDACAAW